MRGALGRGAPGRRGVGAGGVLGVGLLVAALLAGCSGAGPTAGDPSAAPTPSEAAEPPRKGACRILEPEDVARPDNATAPVTCRARHTAETFFVGRFPRRFADTAWDEESLGGYVFPACSDRFRRFVGADESLALRTTLSWAWFRPAEAEWQDGMRWYRCDVVAADPDGTSYVDLPRTTRGVLLGKPDDRWLVCVNGPTVSDSVKIPCSQPHTWRAVTTVVLGQAADRYPGDRVVEVRSRDYCRQSVGAWLDYPLDYDFGYTWFHRAEWQGGNRRSICWARTRL